MSLNTQESEAYHFYIDLATYYDRIYHHIDYELQAKWIVSAWLKHTDTDKRTALDIACGTGSHIIHLSHQGFTCMGVDISPQMLDVARRRCPIAKFVQAEMTVYSLGKRFTLATCMFNSMHYARPVSAFRAALYRAFAHLEKGGILIFDMVDKSIGVDADEQRFEFDDGKTQVVFRPRWQYSGVGELMDLFVNFEIKEDGTRRTYADHHVMCALAVDEARQLCQEVGFSTIKLFRRDFHALTTYTDEKKCIVLARK